MPQPFSPDDILRYRSVTSIEATDAYAACEVGSIDSQGDTDSSRIWLLPLAEEGPPVEFTSESDSDPKWSPDGSELAFLSSRDQSLQIHLIRADGGEARAVSRMNNGVSYAEWSPDGRSFIATARIEVDPAAKGERAEPPRRKAPHVVWRLPYKTDGIGYVLDREIHLFSIDKQSGDCRQLTDGPFDVRSACFSPDGRRIAYARTRTGREAHRTDIWVMDADGGNAERLSSDVAAVQSPHWSPDGRWIAFSGGEKEGDAQSRLWLIDTHDRSVRPLGADDIEVESGTNVHWSADSSALIFVVVQRGMQHIASIRVADGQLDVLVAGERHILNLAVTSRQLVYTAAAIGAPAEVYSCALDGRGERKLTDFNAWWRDRSVPRISVRSFDVPDGNGGTEKIEGWLMVPADRGEAPLPLFVDVHGGPQSVHYVEFSRSPWRHVLCGRGWAVLALNPVGSSSYGTEFMARLRGRWGEIDLPQQMAAIETLQREGLADDRLAIYGKSYGGYLAAWAITQTNMFKAAVIAAPVANIESHFGTSDSGFYVTPFAMCGEPYVNPETARKLSPLVHMHKATTPTLLLQGADDQRCPVGQSEEIFATLIRSSDVAVEMVLYPGEDHHLVEEGTPSCRVDYITRLVEWVDQRVKVHKEERSASPDKETQSSSGGPGNP